MKIFVAPCPEFTFITIKANGTVFTPSDLQTIEFPSVNPCKGVIIEGNCPEWMYGVFLLQYHYCAFTGVHNQDYGVIVTSSHHSDYSVGDVIAIFTNKR